MSKITQQEIATGLTISEKPKTLSIIPAKTKSLTLAPEKTKTLTLTTTQRITYCATFVAMAFMFKLLGNAMIIGGFKFTLIYIPWILCAILMGPYAGAIVGLGTDLLGTLLMGLTPIPLVILSNTLFPLIIGLIYRYLPVKSVSVKLIVGFCTTLVFCTLTLSTVGLTQYYGMPFWPYLITFRLAQACVVIINMVLSVLMVPLMKRILKIT